MVLSNEMDLAESRINRYFLTISAYTQYCESRLKNMRQLCPVICNWYVPPTAAHNSGPTFFYITQLLTKALKPNLENVAKGALNLYSECYFIT